MSKKQGAKTINGKETNSNTINSNDDDISV